MNPWRVIGAMAAFAVAAFIVAGFIGLNVEYGALRAFRDSPDVGQMVVLALIEAVCLGLLAVIAAKLAGHPFPIAVVMAGFGVLATAGHVGYLGEPRSIGMVEAVVSSLLIGVPFALAVAALCASSGLRVAAAMTAVTLLVGAIVGLFAHNGAVADTACRDDAYLATVDRALIGTAKYGYDHVNATDDGCEVQLSGVDDPYEAMEQITAGLKERGWSVTGTDLVTATDGGETLMVEVQGGRVIVWAGPAGR